MRLLSLFLLSALLASGVAAQGPTTLVGRVVDGRTGEGLAGASVFLAGTQRGTVADAEGRFTLVTTLTGRFDLVGSLLGYAAATERIVLAPGEAVQVQLALTPQEGRLPGLTVEDDGRAWRRNLARFTKVFVGEVPNAEYVRLLNPNVLRFALAGDTLRAWAEGPLEIENMALGYRLYYVLTGFEAFGAAMRWTGSALFQDLEPRNRRQRRQWQQARLRAYEGSFRHFLHALARGEAAAEGFAVTRSDDFRSPLFLLRYPEVVMKQGETGGLYWLEFTGILHVRYIRENADELYKERQGMPRDVPMLQNSMLELLRPRVAFTSQGLLLDPYEAVKYDYWTYEDRIANLLPYEYSVE